MLGSFKGNGMNQRCSDGTKDIALSLVDKTVIRGFLAGHDGTMLTANPYDEDKERSLYQCWEYGWLCRTCSRPKFPLAIEFVLNNPPVDRTRNQEIRDHFQMTRELPKDLLKILRNCK